MTVPEYYICLSAVLFGLGALGVVIRKDVIVILMCIELMLNAVNLSFIAFARIHGLENGHVYVFFVMTVAAAEAAVGLAIVISYFRNFRSAETAESSLLKG